MNGMRDFLDGIGIGFLLGVMLCLQCQEAPKTTTTKTDTLTVVVKQVDTVYMKQFHTQKVILENCQRAAIVQEGIQEGKTINADSIQIQAQTSTVANSQSLSFLSPRRFSFGVGITTPINDIRPTLEYSVGYKIHDLLRLQTSYSPTYRIIGIRLIGGF